MRPQHAIELRVNHGKQGRGMTSGSRNSQGASLFWPLVLSFVFLSAGIVALGFAFFRISERHLKTGIEQQLLTIADLKRSQIVQWRNERLSNGFDIMDDRFAQQAIGQLRRMPQDRLLGDTVQEWMEEICRNEHYRSAALLDPEGTVLCETAGCDYLKDSSIVSFINQAVAARTPLLGNMSKGNRAGKPEVHLVIPMGCRSDGSIGNACSTALVLSVDPALFLFPLIQQWPLPSRSSETLLLRREGNKVVFLNDLRFRKNAALSFVLPVDDPDLLCARAARGDTGLVEGMDYRGAHVIGALLSIPESSWFMVAKVDKDEVLSPVRRLFELVLALVLSLIVLIGFLLGMLQRNHAARRYRELLSAAQERAVLVDSLADSERRYRSLFENMTEGVALHEIIRNAAGDAVDYRILDVNSAYERHVEIPIGNVKGQLATALYGVDPAPYLDLYTGVAETGSPRSFETFFAPLGKHFAISVFSPAHDRFATVFEDITDRKRTEEKVAEERERLLVTIRSIGDGVITTDVGGAITLMNKVAEELTGWHLAESIGRPLAEVFNIINEFTRVQCVNPVDKVLATGGIIGLANHTALIRRDGSEISIADSGSPIRDRESRIIGVVLVFRDITDKIKSEQALLNAQRLESIGILAGGIAHDFNNLLGGIFGYIDIARERAEEGNAQQAADLLARSLAVFDRAKSLTRQLLTFSKGGMPIRKTQHLSKLVRDAVHFVLSGSRVTASITIPEDVWLCDFDENQMAQVIDNITLNACQAMPTGGKIEVSVANVQPGSAPAHLPPLQYVRIDIRDFGIGISPEHQTRIFDPFFSTKQQGSGLGLATSYSIVKKHDGYIEVASELGKGSTFSIFLPASGSQNLFPAYDSSGEPVFRGSGRVLIMDDEDFLLDVGTDMLQNLGFEVAKARHGEEAISMVEEAIRRNAPFIAAILDLTIPGGLGGQETVGRLLEIAPTLKVVASSGYADSPIMANPDRYGFCGRLVKPYRKNELSQVMRVVCGG
jgi:PAS domain S-box-containing protein